MADLIPTNPEDYDLEKIRAELARIEAVLPALESYQEREFRELPEKIQGDVRTIQLITQPTVGGLEKVRGILVQLWVAERMCRQLLNGESIANTVAVFYGQAAAEEGQTARMPSTAPAALGTKGSTFTVAADAAPAQPPQPVSTATFAISELGAAKPSASTLVIPPSNP